jgi:hypothetical protein
MNRRKVISLSALTAFGFALLTGSAVSQQKSLKDQLVGTWTVQSWDQRAGLENLNRAISGVSA